MTALLPVLSVLACPVMMGLMLWLMMRGHSDHATENPAQTCDPDTPVRGMPQSLLKKLHLCLDWKVVGGLAAIGLGVWIVAPKLVWAALPLLVVLACPLSMLFMMRGMGGRQRVMESRQVQHTLSSASILNERPDPLEAARTARADATIVMDGPEALRQGSERDMAIGEG
ncbi:MAG: DUF2933 domain-containing protein [Chloroflexota bacterium]|nr:DUF2933 domain-containing protein [Chloroflexota bacterium]